MKYNPETPIADIKPYDKNPRHITIDATNAVAASIEGFGFLNPIVIDKNGVILAGHNRYKAAKKLGLQTVPTLTAEISELKARGYRIASNKTAELAQWDRDALDAELSDIMAECDSLIDAMGISEWEVRRIQAQAEKSAPAAAADATSAPPQPAQQAKPQRSFDAAPRIVRSLLILDKPEQLDELLEMTGFSSASEIPATMHAADLFKKV